jgi:hypothetical protein
VNEASAPRDLSAFTKADTSALWHAVTAYDLQVRAMRDMDFAPEVLKQEQDRVVAAKRALRKAQAMVRAARTKKEA